jgi:hypothetical protein
MSYPGLGADFYGPPRQGQTDEAYQSQMSPVVAVSIGAIALVNPFVGLAVGIGYLLTRPTQPPSSNRFSKDERKGGH